MKIFHPDIGVILQLFHSIIKGTLQLGNVFLGSILELDKGLVLQILGFFCRIGINILHAAGDAQQNLLILPYRGLCGRFQLLDLLVEPLQQLSSHLLELLAIFLGKISGKLGDTPFEGRYILLVLVHLLFQLVHNGRFRADTTHILFQIGSHFHQLLEGVVVSGNLVVDGVHRLNPRIEFLGQVVELTNLFLQISYRGNSLRLLYLHLVVLIFETRHLVIKFSVKILLLDADIFLDLVQGTIVLVNITKCQRKDRRDANSYEYSKDRHILFPTQKTSY